MLPSCGNSKWPHPFAPAGLEAVLKETKFRFFKHSLKFINFVLNQAFFFLRIKEKKKTPQTAIVLFIRGVPKCPLFSMRLWQNLWTSSVSNLSRAISIFS